MSAFRLVAMVLIVAGILGIVYGRFSYTKETHDAKLGPLEVTVKEKETINVPTWAGAGAIAAAWSCFSRARAGDRERAGGDALLRGGHSASRGTR